MSLTKVLAVNTLLQYFGKFLSLLGSVVITSILTKKLGVQGYGQYVYILSLVSLFSSLSDWGSTFVASREASKKPDLQETIYSTTLIARLIISLLSTATFILLAHFHPNLSALRPGALIASALLPLISLKTSFQVVYQTKLQLWRLSLIDTASSLLFVLFILFLPQNNFTTTNVLTLLTISALISALLGLYLVLNLTKLQLSLNLRLALSLAKSSFSMGLLLTVFSVYNRLDILILEHFKGTQAVAYYGLSYKIYENLILGAGYLANTTFPILASASRVSITRFRKVFEKNLAGLLLVGIFVFLFGTVLAYPVVIFLAGPEFLPSVTALQILSCSLLIVYLNHATGFALIALEKQHLSAFAALSALAFNALANYLLIPRYSFLASAVITGLTETLMFLITLSLVLRYIKKINLKRTASYLHPRTIIRLLLK